MSSQHQRLWWQPSRWLWVQQQLQRLQPQQLQRVWLATTAEVAATAATTAIPAAKTASSLCRSPVISPVVTKARKKRKGGSSVDSTEIQQLDGASFSPPPSPDVGSSGSPSVPTPPSPPQALNLAGFPLAPSTVQAFGLPSAPSTRSSGSPSVPTPTPPPPWSEFLPAHPRTVICGQCLAGCHGLGFKRCYVCCTRQPYY